MSYEAIKPQGGDTAMPLTMQKRMSFFSKHNIPLENRRVIDCGCGAGQYVLEFLRRGADAYGVEYDAVKVAKYQQENPTLAHHVIQGDIESIDFPDSTFDVALFNEVLEHVPDDRAALREAYRLLKPGGHLVVFSPNRRFPFESHGVYAKKSGNRLPVYVPFIPYIPLHLGKQLFTYWARNYWPHELQEIIRSAGFQIFHTDFIWQTFENISNQQPLPIRMLRQPLRALATTLKKTPLIRTLGVSQVILSRKPQKGRHGSPPATTPMG